MSSDTLMPSINPHLSPLETVRRFKDHLSRLWVLVYQVLAAVNAREEDEDLRAELHQFPGMAAPGNKVLLKIAEEDVPNYYTQLPSLDRSNAVVDLVLTSQQGFFDVFNAFTEHAPSNILPYAMAGGRTRVRTRVDERLMSEKQAQERTNAKAEGKHVQGRGKAGSSKGKGKSVRSK